jgi:hypothetical protein
MPGQRESFLKIVRLAPAVSSGQMLVTSQLAVFVMAVSRERGADEVLA